VEQKQKKGKSRRKLGLLGALALALVLTAGMFAYTWTTASLTLSGTVKTDYATVSAEETAPGFGNVWGKWIGNVDSGNLFTITFQDDYTGDLVVKVYLTNADELAKAYQHLNMKLYIKGTSGNIHAADAGHEFELLTLDNGVVTWNLSYNSGGGGPFKVYLDGGSFKTNSRIPIDWEAGYSVKPQLFCEVTQR